MNPATLWSQPAARSVFIPRSRPVKEVACDLSILVCPSGRSSLSLYAPHSNTAHTACTAITVAWQGDHGTPSVGHMRQAQPPYRAVSAALRERIDSGEWLPGEQIPSVRKIAEEYGVSIGTARRALVVLREAGLIVVTPSWGAFIPQ